MAGEPVSNGARRRTAAIAPASAVTAKTESQTLIADSAKRRVVAYITNDGANVVYLALGATATKNKGIRLNKEGGAAVIDNYTGVVSVVTAEGESVVAFSEV